MFFDSRLRQRAVHRRHDRDASRRDPGRADAHELRPLRADRSACRRCRVDHPPDRRHLRRGKAADLRMFPDDRLVLGEVDAERLVGRDEALDPKRYLVETHLSIRPDRARRRLRVARRLPPRRPARVRHLTSPIAARSGGEFQTNLTAMTRAASAIIASAAISARARRRFRAMAASA